MAGPAEEVDEELRLTNEAETGPETEPEPAAGAAGVRGRLPRLGGASLCEDFTCRASVSWAGAAAVAS